MSSIWTSPTETDPRLRIQAPNSIARDVLVVALDEASAAYGAMLADEQWKSTTFLGFQAEGSANGAAADWAAVLDAGSFDVVVLVATDAVPAEMVEQIGARCAGRNIKVAVILVMPGEDGIAVLDANLRALRPWADTLAMIEQAPATVDMLHGLGG